MWHRFRSVFVHHEQNLFVWNKVVDIKSARILLEKTRPNTFDVAVFFCCLMVSIVWISVLIIAILLFITVDDAAGVGGQRRLLLTAGQLRGFAPAAATLVDCHAGYGPLPAHAQRGHHRRAGAAVPASRVSGVHLWCRRRRRCSHCQAVPLLRLARGINPTVRLLTVENASRNCINGPNLRPPELSLSVYWVEFREEFDFNDEKLRNGDFRRFLMKHVKSTKIAKFVKIMEIPINSY